MTRQRPNGDGSVIYGLRKEDPNCYVQAKKDEIYIYYSEAMALVLTRQNARLLAKRINQCLDDSRY